MQRRLLLAILVMFGVLLGSGCSQEAMLNRLTTAEERSAAIRFVEAVRRNDRRYLMSVMEPEVWRGSQAQLDPARSMFPAGDLRWMATGAATHTIDTGSNTMAIKEIVLEGSSGGRWIVAAVVTRYRDGAAEVVSWSVTPFSAPPGEPNAFTLSGKSVLHWLWLALCIGVPLLSIAAIVSIWRGPRIRWRVLWTLGCLIGLAGLTMNWTTGAIFFQLIRVQLLGAGLVKPGPYAPWFLTVSVPVVVLFYFGLRKRLRAGAGVQAEAKDGTPYRS